MIIVAHRGGDTYFPENTVEAGRDALASGADMVEGDVRFTADSVPVISHDADLSRLFGDPRRLSEVPLAEYRRLRHRSNPAYGPATLRDLVEAGVTPLLLHIKEGGEHLQRLMDELESLDARERVVLGVGSVGDAATVSGRREPWRMLGFIPSPDQWRAFVDAGVRIIRLWDGWLSPAVVSAVRESGAEVWVMSGGLPGLAPTGVVADGRDRLYRSLEVDGILVNDPEWFARRHRRAAFPRLVAHRGVAVGCPENTIAAFMNAVALDLPNLEIELDVRGSADRRLVVSHDARTGRIANADLEIASTGIAELRAVELRGELAGTRLCTLPEVFQRIGPRCGYNIHIKETGERNWIVASVIEQIQTYGLVRQAYVAGDADVLAASKSVDPAIERCCLAGQTDGSLLQNAARYECTRVQFFRGHASSEDFRNARTKGYICNYFYSDSPEEGAQLCAHGVDALLSNRADRLARAVYGTD